MQEDSFAMWQRLGRAQTPFTKTYASAGVSLLLVAVIATAAVGIYSHHTGVLKIGKPNLIAYKLK